MFSVFNECVLFECKYESMKASSALSVNNEAFVQARWHTQCMIKWRISKHGLNYFPEMLIRQISRILVAILNFGGHLCSLQESIVQNTKARQGQILFLLREGDILGGHTTCIRN